MEVSKKHWMILINMMKDFMQYRTAKNYINYNTTLEPPIIILIPHLYYIPIIVIETNVTTY